MKTITVKLYSINELNKEAKERALENYREKNTEIFWADETFKSLKGLFENCNGVKIKDYSLGEYNSWIKAEFERDEVETFTGKRAMAWIENNLLSSLRISFKGDKRKELRQYGQYYYAGKIKPCPFTGYCTDENFLDSLLNDIKQGNDLKTAFEGLATEYQRIIQNEVEYQNSEEYIIEQMEANNEEFLEDGTRY